jgi:hypothetical protein
MPSNTRGMTNSKPDRPKGRPFFVLSVELNIGVAPLTRIETCNRSASLQESTVEPAQAHRHQSGRMSLALGRSTVCRPRLNEAKTGATVATV